MSTEDDDRKPEEGNQPSPPPPGSPPDEGVAITGGADPTKPAWEGVRAAKVDPPIPESERPRASDT